MIFEPLVIDGHTLPVRLRTHPKSRRLTLRLAADGASLNVVAPPGLKAAEIRRFLDTHRPWIAERLGRLAPRVPFAEGSLIPLLGVPHRVVHAPTARRGVWTADGQIHISGHPEHLPRRLADWLRAQARAEITPRVHQMAARLGKTPGRITLRDPTSRWGSCAANGNLAFSWRLILAPDYVLAYVVAHEVAHLAHLNHGPRFHTTVRQLIANPTPARQWLKTHGPTLHRFG
ncbi:M48 family metallopeptidase [Roseospirillum parvum]|uniref:YgjP-like metallopeptidase domain-containing protein n=1 Tax=Roseospirillum parvum TaxID=83401 RepID=A0A1G7ZQD1_9PROT|nr:SprT family zinc-dependent metalloprotease [Roseospirillum parvum]SDH10845.1 hypothetical protein SAMN05421742_104183 [Roseospirillum parvum]